MQSLFWLAVWLLLFAGTSAPAAPAPAQAPPTPASSVTLDYGAGIQAAGGDLALTFTGVAEDSRCPSDVACVWSGMVVVTLQIQPEGQPAATVQLGGLTDSEGAVTGPVPARDVTNVATVDGYTVQLLAVTPYPTRAGAPLSVDEYQIELRVQAGGGG